jgi:hypothetical protein
MTSEQLIEAIQRECRVDALVAEDFVTAFVDLMVEALKRGEAFNFGKAGFFAIHPPLPTLSKDSRAMLIFQGTKTLRERLGITGKTAQLRASPVCKTCGLAPCKVRVQDECEACAGRDAVNGNHNRGDLNED